MASAFLLAIPPRTALAICRVIESDRAPVAFDPTTSAFYVLAPDVVIGWDCPSGPMDADAGSLDLDAGAFDIDAGTFDLDGGAATGRHPRRGDLDDLEAPLDVGVIELDGGMPDAGSPGTRHGRHAAPGRSAPRRYRLVVSLVVSRCSRRERGADHAGPRHPQAVPATPAIFARLLSRRMPSPRSWLDDNGFSHARRRRGLRGLRGRRPLVRGAAGPSTAGEGARDLAPLVVSWLGSEVPVTHRLQYDPEGGTLATDAWVLAPTRMDVEDGSAITSSADRVLPVPDTLRGFGLGFGYLTHLRIARQQRDEADSHGAVANES
jgi:hypothetical protein